MLQAGQHYADALIKLDELEKSFPKQPEIQYLRGAILLTPGLRNFDAAAAAFQKAAEMDKGSPTAAFNLAEVAFVRHHWNDAGQRFEALLATYPKAPMQIRHLVVYKIFVCQLQLGELKAAEKTLKEHFTFMDDTPAYYFAKAAEAFQRQDKQAAEQWVAKGEALFGVKDTAAYMDTLVEVRWLPHVGLPSLPKEP